MNLKKLGILDEKVKIKLDKPGRKTSKIFRLFRIKNNINRQMWNKELLWEPLNKKGRNRNRKYIWNTKIL